MNTITLGVLVAGLALAGCTQNTAKNNGSRTAGNHPDSDPYATRRMITGSHVPQPVDRPTFDNVSANIPVGSASRKPDSLVPSEPTVGARGQSTYRLDEPSTGAGPEGEPTVDKKSNHPTPRPSPTPN